MSEQERRKVSLSHQERPIEAPTCHVRLGGRISLNPEVDTRLKD
jgi:hypothetical protein